MPRTASSAWLTAVRLRRLCTILRKLTSKSPGLPMPEAARGSWNACGGPFDEVPQLIGILAELGLLVRSENSIQRNGDGDRLAGAIGRGDLTGLGIALVRAGFFYDQARRLIESGAIGDDGGLRCPLKIARVGAPQLLGVLQWWKEVQLRPLVVVPKGLVGELNTVWALIPPSIDLPKWAAERKAIGDRAEMYTVQLERMRTHTPSQIYWVARDSDTLGWDVEDRANVPHRLIEVKGSRDLKPVFYLSENEWNKAHQFGPAYEVQFWGEVDLGRAPAIEFTALRTAGYPVVITNIASAIASGIWTATAVRWRVERA